MRLLALGGALLILAACSGGKDKQVSMADGEVITLSEGTASDHAGIDPRDPEFSRGVGKIIDNVGAIRAEQLNGLSRGLAEIDRLGGPRVTVVLVQPTSGESMEQLGWALAGRPTGKAVMLLIDPASAVVRIEGALDPARKARVAAAMAPQLRAKQPGYAIQVAINILRGAS